MRAQEYIYEKTNQNNSKHPTRAKELRKEPTPSEKLLWERLRNRQLGGFKFRRQAPMGRVIADFYCAESKLIIELDGDIHDLQIEEDEQRTKEIESFGYRVIRFRNEEIEKDIKSVLSCILNACQQTPFSRNREKGRG